MKIRSIGDVVWIARLKNEPVRIQCPDCLGTQKWHCVLPSGEEFDVECARCYHGGYDPSTGWVEEDYKFTSYSIQTTITGIEMRPDNKVEYSTPNGCSMSADSVFDTEAEAQDQGAKLLLGQLKFKHEAMKLQARSKGRPKKKADGSREANPSEFGGGTANYAKQQVRNAIKDAMRWIEYARTHKTEIDIRKMINDSGLLK